jgi:hypothetical protein
MGRHLVGLARRGLTGKARQRLAMPLLRERTGWTSEKANRPRGPRVEYDVERAARAILESELPDDFAEYLETGGRPGAAPGRAISPARPAPRP